MRKAEERKKTYQDMQEDYALFLFLYHRQTKKLFLFQKQLQAKKIAFSDTARDYLIKTIKTYNSFGQEFLMSPVVKDSFSSDEHAKRYAYLLLKRKREEMLRIRQKLIASLIVASDWQSPSFDFTLFSQAGRQTGTIQHALNDYKRDFHYDAQEWEKTFVKVYLDGITKLGVNAYVTTSGMAAFTTAMLFLLGEGILKKGPFVMGRGCYFQNKEWIKKSIADVYEVDEMDTKKLCHVIRDTKPAVVYVDSLGNNDRMSVVDMRTVLSFLKKEVKHDMVLLLDNTCLGVSFQILPLLKGHKHIQVLVVESLLKYHQFGLDRVNAGIVWSYGKNSGKLFGYRQQAGAVISDDSLFCLAPSSRKNMEAYLQRLGRNALLLATLCQSTIEDLLLSPFSHVVYPGLSNHPAFSYATNLPFQGSFFALSFKKGEDVQKRGKQFIATVMQEARKQNVQIVGGTSFGFSSTRLYLTSTRAQEDTAFLRIAVGTETRAEVTRVGMVLQQVLLHMVGVRSRD